MRPKISLKEALHRRVMNFKKVPNLKRQEYHRFKRLRTTGWRRPKGIHSKLRLQRDGRTLFKAGHGSDRRVRFMISSIRRFPVMVQDLYTVVNKVWREDECCIIRSQVSNRKRVPIRVALEERGIPCLN